MPAFKPSDLLIVFWGSGVVSRRIIARYSANGLSCAYPQVCMHARGEDAFKESRVHTAFLSFLFQRRGDDGRALAFRMLAHAAVISAEQTAARGTLGSA